MRLAFIRRPLVADAWVQSKDHTSCWTGLSLPLLSICPPVLRLWSRTGKISILQTVIEMTYFISLPQRTNILKSCLSSPKKNKTGIHLHISRKLAATRKNKKDGVLIGFEMRWNQQDGCAVYLTNFLSITANPLSVQPVKILPTAVSADGQSYFDLCGDAGTNVGVVGDQTSDTT